MWWTIGIFGGVCLVGFLWWALILGARAVGEEANKKSVLAAIAKEYLVRRQNGQNGETLDQVADSLYKLYPGLKPIEFPDYNPMPPGHPELASLMEQVPEEARQLSKIAYTLLCHRGVYPMPQPGKGARDSAAEFAAMTGMLRECVAQLAPVEAAGGQINQDLLAMVNKWSDVLAAIASKVLNRPPTDGHP